MGRTLFIGVILAAPVAPWPADPVGDEVKRFAGTWAVVSHQEDGKVLSKEEFLPNLELVPRRDHFVDRVAGKEPYSTIRVDPSAKPRTMDVVYLEEIAPGVKGRWLLGIYEWVDEDTFRHCRPLEPGGPRPDKFDAGKGSGRMLVVWKRVKKPGGD